MNPGWFPVHRVVTTLGIMAGIENRDELARIVRECAEEARELESLSPVSGTYGNLRRELERLDVWARGDESLAALKPPIDFEDTTHGLVMAGPSTRLARALPAIRQFLESLAAPIPETREREAIRHGEGTPTGPDSVAMMLLAVDRAETSARELARDAATAPFAQGYADMMIALREQLANGDPRTLESTARTWLELLPSCTASFTGKGTVVRTFVASMEALEGALRTALELGALQHHPDLAPWARTVDPIEGHTITTLEACVLLVASLEDSDAATERDLERVNPTVQADALREAFQDWARDGVWAADEFASFGFTKALVEPRTVQRWNAVRAYVEPFLAWIEGGSLPESAPDDLTRTLARLHAIHRVLAPDRTERPRNLARALQDLAGDVSEWMRLLHVRRTPSGKALRELAFATFPLAGRPGGRAFVERIDQLFQTLRDETRRSPSDPMALANETAELDILAQAYHVTIGHPDFDRLRRAFATLLREGRGGASLPEHVLRQLDLQETFHRSFAAHLAFDGDTLAPELLHIATFFDTWRPLQGEDAEPHDVESEDDDERVRSAPPEWSPRPTGWSHHEFLWNVASSARKYSDLGPARIEQAIGVQLRAIHRWLAPGRSRHDEEREAVQTFFTRPDVARRLDDAIRRRDFESETVQRIAHHFVANATHDDAPEPDEHAYPEDLVSPEHEALWRTYALADLEAWLAHDPRNDQVAQRLAHLRRLDQEARGERVLSATSRAEACTALRSVSHDTANPFPDVPDFLSVQRHVLSSIARYRSGQTIANERVLETVIEQARRACQDVIERAPWAERRAAFATLERQLRALRRWLDGGRSPSSEAVARTLATFQPWIEDEESKQRDEALARQLAEIATALENLSSLERSDAVPHAPTYALETHDGFLNLLEPTRFETRELGYAFPGEPTRAQRPFAEIASKLEALRDLCKDGVASTTRQRTEARSLIEDLERVDGSLTPSIPDYVPDLRARLEALVAWFDHCMQSQRARDLEIREVGFRDVRSFRVARTTGTYTLFTVGPDEGDAAGLYRCACETIAFDERRVDDLRILPRTYRPSTKDLQRVEGTEGRLVEAPAFSRTYDDLAWVDPAEHVVSWRRLSASEDTTGSIAGTGFLWSPSGAPKLFVFDPERGQLVQHDMSTGQGDVLATLDRHGVSASATHPPHITVSSSRDLLAFCGPGRSGVDLHLLKFVDRKPVTTLVRSYPARTRIHPFWIGMGRLGLAVFHADPARTQVLAFDVRDLGETELWNDPRASPPHRPGLSPSGRFLATLVRAGAATQVILHDLDTGAEHVVETVDDPPQELVLGDGVLYFETRTQAMSLWLRDFVDCRVPPPKF